MATSKIINSSVRYIISSFVSGMTGKLDIAINRETKSCVISGYIDTTNKTSNALVRVSTDIDTCVENKWFPVSTNALNIWTNNGQFEYSNDSSGAYIAWTGTGGINVIHCAFVMAL